VLIDGRLIGYVLDTEVENFVNSLRILKVKAETFPKETEIAWLKKMSPKNTAYPMVFISYAMARFLRPVKFLPLNQTEWISPL
jgi:DNA-directed RNA polymerase I subunit RPA2